MNKFLSELLLAIITAAVPVLTVYAVNTIRKIGTKTAADADDIMLQGYIEEITTAVTDAVAATSQTYVDALKKADKFDKEAQADAARKALTACIASISPAAQAFIEEAYGNISDYLGLRRVRAAPRRRGNAGLGAYPELAPLVPCDGQLPQTRRRAAGNVWAACSGGAAARGHQGRHP